MSEWKAKYGHNKRITRGPALPHNPAQHARIQRKIDELGNANLSERWNVLKERNDIHELVEFEARVDQMRKQS